MKCTAYTAYTIICEWTTLSKRLQIDFLVALSHHAAIIRTAHFAHVALRPDHGPDSLSEDIDQALLSLGRAFL